MERYEQINVQDPADLFPYEFILDHLPLRNMTQTQEHQTKINYPSATIKSSIGFQQLQLIFLLRFY